MHYRWLSFALCAACALEGGGTEPTELIELDAGLAGDAAGSREAGRVPAPSSGSQNPIPAASSRDAALQPTAPSDAASAPPGANPLVPATCDPVANTGCIAFILQQCIVDTSAAQVAGLCVFASANPPETGCADDFFSSSCPPGKSCIRGSCRAACLRDSDCEQGACCVDPATSHPSNPLRVCGPCP